jgi:hypothetical protein
MHLHRCSAKRQKAFHPVSIKTENVRLMLTGMESSRSSSRCTNQHLDFTLSIDFANARVSA